VKHLLLPATPHAVLLILYTLHVQQAACSPDQSWAAAVGVAGAGVGCPVAVL
jgi:hypothetical protein